MFKVIKQHFKQERNSNLDCLPYTAVVRMSDQGGGSQVQLCQPGASRGLSSDIFQKLPNFVQLLSNFHRM